MPKSRIQELDKTGIRNYNGASNVVYYPFTLGESGGTTISPTLYSKAKPFTADCADLDKSIIEHLIDLGFEVLAQSKFNLEQGEQGPGPGAKDWEVLEDKGVYDIRFLTYGTLGEAPEAMINCAKHRGDCIALVNLMESDASFSYDISSIRAAFQSLIPAVDTDNVDKGAYAAGFTPWFIAQSVAGNNKIPAAFGYLFAYANSLNNTNPEWLSIAGPDRGRIPELTGLCYEYSTNDIEMLQARSTTKNVELKDNTWDTNDNVGIAINPIANIRPFGIIIYGNRTMRDNQDITDPLTQTIQDRLTASSFLNVRNLVCSVKKKMYDASRRYTFEQNTDKLWVNFQSYIRPTLDKMQSGDGILGYKFTKVNTPMKARLKAKLHIIPVEAVEDFDLEVILTDALEVNE